MFPEAPPMEWVYFWGVLLAVVIAYTLYFAVTTYLKDQQPKITFGRCH
jgi:protein-S-isoprenylcysteine O-methyltransferase Ste14